MLAKFVVLTLLLSCVLAARPKKMPSETDQFTAWMARHGKQYANAEEHATRFGNFLATLKRVQAMNGESTAKFGLNKFSDLTPSEFSAKYLMKKLKSSNPLPSELFAAPVKAAPAKFDWRTQDLVTPVKDQGQCGSCWAFSATENIESVWMMAKSLNASTMEPLAPQQIVDCDSVDGGCNGGDTPTAYNYVKKAGGLEPEKDYPYHARDESCRFKSADIYAKITGYKYATTQGDEATLRANLATISALSICVDAENWQDYTSGVMTAAQCCRNCQLDHCVQLVGYDTTASAPYYIVRNSWGTDWGMSGYILLEIGKNPCGVTDEATSATA